MLGPYVVEAAAKTASEADPQGWVRCTIPLEAGDLGIRELMRLGVDVEVLAPMTLRNEMAQTLRQTLQRYAPRSPRHPPASGTRRR